MDNSNVTLITGASGEMGSALIRYLSRSSKERVVALDLRALNPELASMCQESVAGSVLDLPILNSIFESFDVSRIFHLAAVLSTGAEKDPLRAEEINVRGTLNLLNLARLKALANNRTIQFNFPSTIAAYGITSKEKAGHRQPVQEEEFLNPIGMYGINKLYCERLGSYFSDHYELLNPERKSYIDFRSIRFPGIISAESVPSGGTSDYGPAMLHAAAQGKRYNCFVRADATLPFMVMPDAVKALVDLAGAPATKLSRRVYNVNAFSVSAKDIELEIRKYFPTFQVDYESISVERQRIVDSWPSAVNDSAARRDWSWAPNFDLSGAFSEYLVPGVRERYQPSQSNCSNY